MTSTTPVRPARTPRFLLRLTITALVLAAGLMALGPVANPPPARAGALYMESLLVKWINSARANKGIPQLRVGSKLTDLAGDRARTMASTNKLAHADCLACLLRSRGVSFSACGEVIASNSYPYGYEAARAIYRAWKGSSGHWSILMSRSYKRFGVGIAYRSSNRTTFGSVVLAG